tara:strand:+ start:113 stop:367 length:255 start_codon:yes stop_codon:yes gene_type:complete
MKSKRDKGLGKYKGTYLQTGSQEEKDAIDRKKHVAAIKAAIEKGQFVKNDDLTEKEKTVKKKSIKTKKKQLRKIRSSRKNKINY